MPAMTTIDTAGVRLDKWLWAARFYKTRSLATDEVGKGRVLVNGQAAKPSRDVKLGDVLRLRTGTVERELVVLGISAFRGPAPQAQALYAETPESLAANALAAERRRLAPEPAMSIAQGRPTKQNRRAMADWNRWSASTEPD
jgi:ribosome-associated heat shock protein Hsp15